MHPGDILVIEPSGRLSLVFKPLHCFRIGGLIGREISGHNPGEPVSMAR